MKIIHAYPPNLGAILRHFPSVKGRPGVIFAWGDRIYNPGGQTLPFQIMAHEVEHAMRQNAMGGPEKWWDRYLNEPEFMWTQELFAHRVEYREFKKIETSPQRQLLYLDNIAKRFSGLLYNHCISYARARALIENFESIEA